LSAGATLRVALVTEVFYDDPGGARLREHLRRAREDGADVAVLPELPLNDWAPAQRTARAEDAEMPDGPRQKAMASAASDVGIALLGGAIVLDVDSGDRHNTAVLYADDGSCLARYRKIHLPEEEGYWETSHYAPGREPPRVATGLPMRVGIQICSDVNRPQGTQLLATQGAEVILAPRATPPDTYDRWRMVLRANAVMSGAYVISTNRPRPEGATSIGGPSIAIAPSGEVVVETVEPVLVVTLDRASVERASRSYPGYLKRFPKLYAQGWAETNG